MKYQSGSREAIFRILFCCGLLCAVGCGAETYEQRLQETVKHYEYLERLNAAVSKTEFDDQGISFRIPLGFTEVPGKMVPVEEAAEPTTDDFDLPNEVTGFGDETEVFQPGTTTLSPGTESEEGLTETVESDTVKEKEPEEIDSRQPEFLDWELPGLAGLWTRDIEVLEGEDVAPKPTYLYALTNYDLWQLQMQGKAKAHEDPMLFIQNLRLGLIDALEVEETAVQQETLDIPLKPDEKKFVEKQLFDVFTFAPEKPVNGVEVQWILYCTSTNQDSQAALLLIVPVNTTDDPRKQIEMALYTLSTYKPGGTGRSAPAGGGGGAAF